MKAIPNQENKFTCKKGETVTFTFDENGSTVFLVTNAFITPVNPAKVDEEKKNLVFTVEEDTVLLITYVFSNPASGNYDINIKGSEGGNFSDRVTQPIRRRVANRTYTFGIA